MSGVIRAAAPKPRDASQARAWAKGNKQRAVSKGKAAAIAARGK